MSDYDFGLHRGRSEAVYLHGMETDRLMDQIRTLEKKLKEVDAAGTQKISELSTRIRNLKDLSEVRGDRIEKLMGAHRDLQEENLALKSALSQSQKEVSAMRLQIRNLKAEIGGYREAAFGAVAALHGADPNNWYREAKVPQESAVWKIDFKVGFDDALSLAIQEEKNADAAKANGFGGPPSQLPPR